MLEIVLWALLAIAVAGGLCALAVVFLPAGEQIAPPLRDEPVWMLPPDRGLRAEDVDTVRLPVALRGYRFAETDQLLDRLADELRSRDLELAQLRGDRPAHGYDSMPAPVIEDNPPAEPVEPAEPAPSVVEPSVTEPSVVEPSVTEPPGDRGA